jgi:hypothetical protein
MGKVEPIACQQRKDDGETSKTIAHVTFSCTIVRNTIATARHANSRIQTVNAQTGRHHDGVESRTMYGNVVDVAVLSFFIAKTQCGTTTLTRIGGRQYATQRRTHALV